MRTKPSVLFLAVALLTTAAAALADIEISAPQLLRRAPSQMNVAVASGAGDFLEVWQDLPNYEVRAARVAADGTVLDPGSFHVTGSAAAPAWTPAVAWTGTQYLVVTEQRSATWLTPVSVDGRAGESRQLIAPSSLPQIGSSSAGTVVVARGLDAIRIAALDSTGSLAHTNMIAGPLFDGPKIAPLADSFLIVWAQPASQATASVYCAIVTAHGEVVGQPRLVAEQAGEPVVASAGSSAFIAYRRYPEPMNSPTLLGRIVTSGSTSGEITIATGPGSTIVDATVAAHDGAFTVVWTAAKITNANPAPDIAPIPPTALTLDAATVSLDGVVHDRVRLLSDDASGESPAITSNGQRLLLSWLERTTASDARIAAALLNGIGTPVQPLDIAHGASNQEQPRLATAGDVTLVAWMEDASNGSHPAVHVRRLDRAGRFLDDPRRWSGGETVDWLTTAMPEHAFAVAWRDANGHLFARRMRIDGSDIDAQPLSLGEGQLMMPAIASDGESFAVLGFKGPMLTAAIIRPSGVVESHDLIPYSAPGWTLSTLAWNGTEYVAAVCLPTMIDTTVGPVSRQQINVLAFSRDGVLLRGPLPLTAGNVDHANPSLACRAGSCLVAWQGTSVVEAALVAGDRVTHLDPIAGAYSFNAQVTLAPAGFNCSWSSFDGTSLSLLVRSVDQNGALSTPRLLGSFNAGAWVDVAPTVTGALVVAYTKFVEGGAYGGAPRVFVRVPEVQRHRAASSR